MSRISIDVTPEQHQRLKALAAKRGKSIEEFVLERTLGETDASAELAELEALLDQRIAEARAKGATTRTVGEVFNRARRELNASG